jgi:hypothetical protein
MYECGPYWENTLEFPVPENAKVKLIVGVG